jgi:NAD(P)-dependent dehydrogenase (short-subunit alcohol dehydrogenase family)
MGLATAKLLASRGATISLADINEKALETATRSWSFSYKHMSTVVDVRNSKSVDEWIQSTVDRLGKLDGAVNMAGVITPAAPITEETDDNWDLTFAVNTRGVFFSLRAELRAMKAGASIVSPAKSGHRTWNAEFLRIGLCCKCFRPNGCSGCFSLLCQQSGCHWLDTDGSKGESTYSGQLRFSG